MKAKARGKSELTMKVTRADGSVEIHTTTRKIGFWERVRIRRRLKREP